MSYEIAFKTKGGEEVFFHLCGTGSWGEFSRWVEGLPAGEFSKLKELVEEGSTTDTTELAYQLRRAVLSAVGPIQQGVQDTVDAVLDKVGDGDEDETVSVVM